MTDIFKALASITAWVLFVFGCLGLVVGVLIMPAIGGQFVTTEPPPWPFHAAWGLGVMSLTLSVVVMKLRKTLE